MKRKIAASGKVVASKKARKGARRCPCCECAPCACAKTCFCQELKAELMDDEEEDEADDGRFEDELRHSFLRFGEQGA
jgi:hypothetical protein